MTSYLIRRLFHAVIVVIGVTIITFGLQNVVATGPSLARAVIGPKATPGEIRRFLNEYGLSRSLPEQYFHFVWRLLQGNLGYSYKLNESINSIVGQELPRDVLLVGTSLLIAIVIGVAGGLFQATRRNTIIDYAGTALSFVFYSMPIFWLGLLLIQGFSITVHVFPSEAPQSFDILHVIAHPAGLVLPIATLTLVNVALFSRYGRSAMINELSQDYIRTAKAKGASEKRILTRHVLRNSLLPVATMIGLVLPGIITAGLIVEYVFNFPGLGLSFYNAAVTDDYPVELAIILLVGIVTVLGSLFADVAYAVLDPRIRYSED